jgi:hypothetical protein
VKVGLFLTTLLVANCGPAPQKGERAPSTLEDRSYACDAFNVTRSAGPFHATCDKTGRRVAVTFPDKRSLNVGVDDEVTDDGFTYDIHATDAATRDDWNLTVQDK